MMNIWYYDYPIGRLGIAEKEGFVTHILFSDEKRPEDCTEFESAALKAAAKELDEYFQGKRKEFQMPLRPKGTEFQKAAWEALRRIPWGQTRSYKDIAVAVGNPKATRAVGMANNRNPIPIMIPCHRVIGSDGSLTGYGGGLHIKKFLLALENPEK